MEFSKQQIKEAMNQYIADNEDFGDVEETSLITEVFEGYKTLLTENNDNKVSLNLLKEHANDLGDVPKDIFEDFILYLKLSDIESKLL